ncbi:MAG: hypothetical protein ACLFM0_10945 [Spirochaetales bacterium]
MSTRARFFCENCHTEVRAKDKVCPSCGRFFGAVRCPRCSFTGEAKLFREGCPSCGYLGGDGREPEPSGASSAPSEEPVSGIRLPLEAIDPDESGQSSRARRSMYGAPPADSFVGSWDDGGLLPPWFYRLSIVVLSVLLVLLALWFLAPG